MYWWECAYSLGLFLVGMTEYCLTRSSFLSSFICEISPSALKASDGALDMSSWKYENTCGFHKGGDAGGLFPLEGDPEDIAKRLLDFLDGYSLPFLTECYGQWRIWKQTLRGLIEGAKMSMGVLEAIRIFAIAAYYRAHPYKTDRRCKFFLHWNTKAHCTTNYPKKFWMVHHQHCMIAWSEKTGGGKRCKIMFLFFLNLCRWGVHCMWGHWPHLDLLEASAYPATALQTPVIRYVGRKMTAGVFQSKLTPVPFIQIRLFSLNIITIIRTDFIRFLLSRLNGLLQILCNRSPPIRFSCSFWCHNVGLPTPFFPLYPKKFLGTAFLHWLMLNKSVQFRTSSMARNKLSFLIISLRRELVLWFKSLWNYDRNDHLFYYLGFIFHYRIQDFGFLSIQSFIVCIFVSFYKRQMPNLYFHPEER